MNIPPSTNLQNVQQASQQGSQPRYQGYSATASNEPLDTPLGPETQPSCEVGSHNSATGESSVGDGRERAELLESASCFDPAPMDPELSRTGIATQRTSSALDDSLEVLAEPIVALPTKPAPTPTDLRITADAVHQPYSLKEMLKAQLDSQVLAIRADLHDQVEAELQEASHRLSRRFEYKFSSGLKWPEQGILENVNAAVAALLKADPSKRASMVEGARLNAGQAYESHVAVQESTALVDAAARAAYAELLTPAAQHFATTVDANRLAKAHALAKDAALVHGVAEAKAKNLREANAVYATLAFGMADGSTQNRAAFLDRGNQALRAVREAILVEVHHRFFRQIFEEVTRAHDPCEPLVAKDYFRPSQNLDDVAQVAPSTVTSPVGGYRTTSIRSITDGVLADSLNRHLRNLAARVEGMQNYVRAVIVPMSREALNGRELRPKLFDAVRQQVGTLSRLSDNEIEQQLRDLDAALKADVRRDLDGIVSVMGDVTERKARLAAQAYAGSLEAHVFTSLLTSGSVIPEELLTVTKKIETAMLDCTDEAFSDVRRIGEALQALQPPSTFRFSGLGNAA